MRKFYFQSPLLAGGITDLLGARDLMHAYRVPPVNASGASNVRSTSSNLARSSRSVEPIHKAQWYIRPDAASFTSSQLANRKKRPFTDSELHCIFDPQLRKRSARTHPLKFWGPLILLYTLMRPREVEQLYLADVVRDHAVPVFRVDDRWPGQHLLTESCRRLVPVHPRLIELGFLDYVADVQREGHARLFPTLGGSPHHGALVRHMNWLNNRLVRPGPETDGRVRRSPLFRLLGAARLFECGVNRVLVAEITGYRSIDKFGGPKPSQVKELARAIEQLNFDLPAIAPYEPGQFKEFFDHIKRRQDAANDEASSQQEDETANENGKTQ